MKPYYVDVKRILETPGEEIAFSGRLELEATKLGEELVEFSEPIMLAVTLSSVSQGVIVKGSAGGRLRLRCGRCLERFDHRVTVDIDELAVGEGADASLVDEAFPIVDGKIDLAPILYQNIVVEVPIRLLCREDCAGLCPQCGKNLNDEPHTHESEELDERLASLKKFFRTKEG